MFESSITFFSRSNATKAGFEILSGAYETTKIYYQFSNETVNIDKSNSSAAAETNDWVLTDTESGKLRLFDIPSANSTKIEALNITVVVDGGLVEVHINDRFAISTWVWSWYEDSRDIKFFVEDGEIEFGETTIWEGLVDAWPHRGAPFHETS
jgi:beta-fructofuranosidase